MKILFESISPVFKPGYQHAGYLSSTGGYVERIENVVKQVGPHQIGLNWFSLVLGLGGLFLIGSLLSLLLGRNRTKRLVPKLAFFCAGIVMISSAFAISRLQGPGYVVEKQKVLREKPAQDSEPRR